MIMAPNLFTAQSTRKKLPDYSELQFAAGTCNVMRMLVKYHNILWVVSGSFIQPPCLKLILTGGLFIGKARVRGIRQKRASQGCIIS